jgi:serine/threonine protein kinase/Tol biopolymer transport system component
MSSESRVDQLAQSVLQLPEEQRESYLDEICAGDDDLRTEIQTILDSQTEVGYTTTPMESANLAAGLLAGEFVGPFRIIRMLGRGGMGDVYLAEHTGQNREVALKILPESFAADPQRVQRFRQEARAVMALNHPNIVTVYDMGASEVGYFLSTEFVEGETLRARMSHDHFTIDQAVEIAEQIAAALAYAHGKGVIHRDIKPENIMLRPDGYVKVLDFGLAKLSERGAPDSAEHPEGASTLVQLDTSPGIVMGTVQYMSPEQARGWQVDERTDVWSLGVVLYEMIAGRAAFEAYSKNEIIAAILEREPLPISRFVPDIPHDLERVIVRALRKDREERYQVIKDLLLDLRSVRQELCGMTSQSGQQAARRLSASTAEVSAAVTVARGPAWQRSLLPFVVLLALAAVAAIVYKLVLQKSVSKPAAFSSISIARLTSTGKSRLAAIAPDGKYVVHVVDDAGKQSLWIRQVATANNVQIVPASQLVFQGLSFSPDSTFVYFTAHESGQTIRDLFQVSALGGAARKILANVDTAVSFSPDGKRLAFVRRFSEMSEDTLVIANVDGSGERTLVTRKQPDFYSMSGPSWSPDGSTIAVGGGSSDKDGRYMTVLSVDATSGAEKPLTQRRWAGVGRVAWRGQDGNQLLINALEQTLGLYQIWAISSYPSEARRVTNDLSDYRDLSITNDAGILAVTQSDQVSNLWSIDPSTPNDSRQITSGKYDGYYGVVWKPDGQIVYASSNGSNQDLWQADVSGSNARQLTGDVRSNVWPAVSPDGQYLVFSSDRSGTLHLWRADKDGGNAKQLTNGSGEDWPTFSPDGRSVVYTVTGGADRFTLWKVSIDGGQPVRLTEKLSLQSSISPDGKQIACGYRADTRSPWKLVLFPSDGGQPQQSFAVAATVELPMVMRWTPDGRAVTYIDTRNGVSNLWLQPISGGPARQLTNWTEQQIFSFAWSRDGKRIVAARGSRKDDIVLIRDAR